MTLIDFLKTYFLAYGILGSGMIFYFTFFWMSDMPFFGEYESVIMWVRRKSKMNWFGCVIATILLFVVFPLLFVISDLVKAIYWITHVGRKFE